MSLRGFRTGLWTESGLASLPWEVGTAGVRAYKLDVAWVGSGYQHAFSACRQAYTGIESNCDDRGFVWSVCGWAGTQRYSTVWSGDQSGSWEYIRFHIPTMIGAGLSGFSNASSDLDGIFGGSAKTYTRDLQWKTFIPEFYAMSGWATRNRQPWLYGEPYTSVNRQYLKLKMQLVPYLYTYCRQAFDTGLPVVRALALDFPQDTVCLTNRVKYEFLCGEWLLVAPVYKDQVVRDSIYLPAGRWFAYRDTAVYHGPVTLNGYPAPLKTIPVFVRAGAIIPMNPPMLYDGQRPADTITLDVYPDGQSSFIQYEDDGTTKQYREGAWSKTRYECNAPADGAEGPVILTIGRSNGDFNGKLAEKAWWILFHYRHVPTSVLINDIKADSLSSLEELLHAPSGWCFVPDTAQPGISYLHPRQPSKP